MVTVSPHDTVARGFVVQAVSWATHRDQLRAVRRAVFIEEQNVPEELEWDEADEHAYHVMATARDGTSIGTGRLKPDCYIGRMAVVSDWRGCGVGSAMLDLLIDVAYKASCAEVKLHAQTHAISFYARFGFTASGEEFDEAGIAHRLMKLTLAPRC